MTGLTRAAARAADMNLRASLIELDVEEDRAGASVEREVVEQVSEVDIKLIAD